MSVRIVTTILFFWAIAAWGGTFDDFEDPVLVVEPTAEYQRIHHGVNLFHLRENRKSRWWVQNTTKDWVCVWTKVTDNGGAPYIVFFSVSVPPNGGERLLGIVKRGFWPVNYEFNWYVQSLKEPSDYKIYGQCSSEHIAYDSRIPEITLSLSP
jgi:hypothetical protein